MALPTQIKKDIKRGQKVHSELYTVEEDGAVDEHGAAIVKEKPRAKEEEVQEKPGQETPAEDISTPAVAEEVPPEPAPGEKAPDDDPRKQTVDYWKHKYEVLDGKYRNEVPALAEQNRLVQEQLQNVEQILAGFSAVDSTVEAAAGSTFLTEAEIEDYGADLITVVKKAAKEAVSPDIETLRAENNKLRSMLGQVSSTAQERAREAVIRALDTEVPGWKDQNTSEGFLAWLNGNDLYSGRSRQQLLNEAFEANNAPRVVSIFKGYQSEHAVEQQASSQAPAPARVEGQPPQPQVNMETLVAPGSTPASTSSSAQGQAETFTQEEIAAFYRDVQSGKFKNRPKDRAAIEKAIFKAVNENRIKF